jgi:hypothetical protein
LPVLGGSCLVHGSVRGCLGVFCHWFVGLVGVFLGGKDLRQVVIGLLSYLACNIIWFVGEAKMLKLLSEGDDVRAYVWGGLMEGNSLCVPPVGSGLGHVHQD